MTSTYCPRFPRKIRVDTKAWIEGAITRLRIHERVARVRELAGTSIRAEILSLLFFLALILVTFAV